MRVRHLMAVALASLVATAVDARQERSEYSTFRAGDASQESVERVTMVTTTASNHVETVYTSEHQGGSETTRIRMLPDGTLLEATRRDLNSTGAEKYRGRIWLADGKVYSRKTWPSGKETVREKERSAADVVADAGLLHFLRLFPFVEEGPRGVLIASFSQHFVVMNLEKTDRESITVPAGTFDCYRIEGTIDLIIKTIRTTYWVTAQEPHFLVRFEGKRGLFLAPTFVTELTDVRSGEGGE